MATGLGEALRVLVAVVLDFRVLLRPNRGKNPG